MVSCISDRLPCSYLRLTNHEDLISLDGGGAFFFINKPEQHVLMRLKRQKQTVRDKSTVTITCNIIFSVILFFQHNTRASK